ncbi:hypothetical protein I308_104278 [Cryptococcus tetragattii IND107]|uniref:Uncharacterized protein n=1 Tax=Cryptococcus tetragattii IND107 TaxID=1296105 RepID=A0ABR3BPX5_9TREE
MRHQPILVPSRNQPPTLQEDLEGSQRPYRLQQLAVTIHRQEIVGLLLRKTGGALSSAIASISVFLELTCFCGA